MQTCHSCARQNKDRAKFCAGCGQQLTSRDSAQSHPILQNRYRVMNSLGSRGAVYRAQDLRLQNRVVALKENFNSSTNAEKQFYREAKMLKNLTHPHLPAVTDYFIEADGKQYLVMEFIEGEDVQKMLERKVSLSESQVLRWFDQVCEAVDYLHRQTPPIIHRDIKPSNIRISPDNKAILVDFGITKDPFLTTTISCFSSPEQCGNGSTDARSDVYALGATLYAMLTGQAPPHAVDRIATGVPLIAPRQLNPAISPATEKVILRSLQINAVNRLQSVQELREALTAPSQQENNRPFAETPVQENKRPFVETPASNPVGSGQPQVAYRQQAANLGVPVTSSPNVAGFGQRVVASLIDTIPLAIVNTILDGFAGGIGRTQDEVTVLAWLFIVLASFLYYTYFHARSGQTPGKKLLRIKVVSRNGSPISTSQAILRWFGYGISGAILYIGYLWVLIDNNKEAWHDKIANTYVINVE